MLNINLDELPTWAKSHTWDIPTLAKRIKIDEWQVFVFLKTQKA